MVPERLLEHYPLTNPGVPPPPETNHAPDGLAHIGWTYDGELIGQYNFNSTSTFGTWSGEPNQTMPQGEEGEAALRRYYFAAVSATDELVRVPDRAVCLSRHASGNFFVK